MSLYAIALSEGNHGLLAQAGSPGRMPRRLMKRSGFA